MPYSRRLTRANPTCMLFLLDQSESMGEKFGLSDASKAARVSEIINSHIYTQILKCSSSDGIRDYVYVGAIGYGASVGSAFHSRLNGDLFPISYLAEEENILRFQEVQLTVTGRENYKKTTTVPIWIDPISENGTPMAAAFSRAEAILIQWLEHYKDSFPPVVFNITDADFNDGGDPSPIIQRVKALGGPDGTVIVFNICISNATTEPIMFPSSGELLSNEVERKLFAMSSESPSHKIAGRIGF